MGKVSTSFAKPQKENKKHGAALWVAAAFTIKPGGKYSVHIASIVFFLIHRSSQKHNLTLMFDVVSNKISIQVNASLEMKRVCYCTAEAKNLLVATGPCVFM
jgi:hypothetical protein